MDDLVLELQDLTYLKWSKTRKSSGTAGSFLKSYDDTGERKLYYKLSDFDPVKGITGHECVNEIISQRLMTLLGIPHLSYTLIHALVNINDTEYETYLCSSLDYKEPGESKIPLDEYYALYKEPNEMPFEFCKRMHWEKTVYGMLVIDFLIINRDRHGANIEVLSDRKNRMIRLSPLFDQGLSFVCRARTLKEVKAFDPMSDVRIQSFVASGSAFENLKLLPKKYLKKLPPFNADDKKVIFEGLKDVIDKSYIEKIWEIICRRWEYIDNLRNT